MKRIITAINNPKLNEELKKENKFEIIGKDIQYKEAILEILEKNNKIDLIIINEKIPGEINLEKLIKKIKAINENIKIIFILEKENNDIEKLLIKNNIKDIYYNNKINLEELIKIINKNEINIEEEIIKLKKIIEEKGLEDTKVKKKRIQEIKKMKDKINKLVEEKLRKIVNRNKYEEETRKKKHNMSTKIISFSGNHKSGKSTVSLVISFCLAEKNKKVLLVDADFLKQDLSIILKQRKKENLQEKKKENKEKKFYRKNKVKQKKHYYYKSFFRYKTNNKKRKEYKERKVLKSNYNYNYKILKNKKNKIYYYQINNLIKKEIKRINNNLYFFNEFDYIFKNKLLTEEKVLKERLYLFFNQLKKKYDYIIIDVAKDNKNTINKEILKNSQTNFILLEPNLLGIEECKKLLERYLYEWKIHINSLYLIESKKNFISIHKNLISRTLPIKNQIFQIKENKFYSILLNPYFKRKILIRNKIIKNELNKILNKVIK